MGNSRNGTRGGQLVSLGGNTMPNIGESPKDERESTLLEILQEDVPEKYFLSPKACQGILRRAATRGKELPPILKIALEQQAGIETEELQEMPNEPIMIENHPNDSRVKIDDSGTVQTLTGRMGTGGGNVPMVMSKKVYGISSFDSNSMKSPNPHSGIYEADSARTLDLNGGNPACNQGGIMVVEKEVKEKVLCFEPGAASRVGGHCEQDICGTLRAEMGDNRPCIVKESPISFVNRGHCRTDGTAETIRANCHGDTPQVAYAIQGNMIGRADKNGPQGSGVNENVSFSLTSTDKHAVVYALDRASYNQGQNAQFNISIQDDGTAQTLVAKGPGAVAQPTAPPIRYIVRRLTPIECERLQGYPDDWTQLPKIKDMTDEEYSFYLGVFMLDKEITGKKGTKIPTKKALVKWYNKLDSDTSRYKGTGNSIAVPCAHDVLKNIAEANK